MQQVFGGFTICCEQIMTWKKVVHFFNILEVKYDANKHTPILFYNLYKTIVSNNLAKQGDIIKHKNNETLEHDEKFSPMFEDMILLNVIRDIDQRLSILNILRI